MNVKLAYVAVGILIGAGVPYVAGAALNVSTGLSSANDLLEGRHLAVAAQAGPSGVFAQYDTPAPPIYEVATSEVQASATVTVGGASVTGSGPSSLTPASSHIAADVEAGVSNMNKALATAPVAMAKMSESIARNGVIAALAHDDPDVKVQTDQLGAQLGTSFRGFADAIAKDMQRSIKESGIQQQSAGR